METETRRNGFFITTNCGSCFQWLKALLEKLKASVVGFAKQIKQLGKDDPRRITHSVKMGLALSLICLVYYFRPLYDGFGGSSTLWAVFTVVVVFEVTVGATMSRGLNRGCATFLASALGIGVDSIAASAGKKGQPILLGFFIFVISSAASFARFIPEIKASYDYGVTIFILTFVLVSVSSYRDEKILDLAHQRLSTILIGCLTCVLISAFVHPVWAGEELHKLVATNMEKLAEFLQKFGDKFFGDEENDDDKFFLQSYQSVLNSKTTEESFANFARWEPRHGCFKFRHPWKQYLKIGTLIRECAYKIEALNNYIKSPINHHTQEFKGKIRETCTTMSSESGKALLELAIGIRTMTQPCAAYSHVEKLKMASGSLKPIMNAGLSEEKEVLKVVPVVTVASLLIEIVECTEKIMESVKELARLAKFKSIDGWDHVVITVQQETCNTTTTGQTM